METPSMSLLCKLGSIVVHADELISPGGHDFDREALLALLKDGEVVEWLGEMNDMAMLPVKRTSMPAAKQRKRSE